MGRRKKDDTMTMDLDISSGSNNSNNKENIVDVEFSETMEQSYIDYAMSVIISRAVPDVRDGLKPVQRRIVYDMHELGMTSDKGYRKSARVVGDTMGKYHPHGDGSIYGAEVVMAQDFKMSQPLVDGHGNYGSIEGDGAAANRYTECKLEKYTEDILLDDLKEDTVDFVDNYDSTEKEPEVLPSKIPHILINGTEGIAVGMTTKIPPHNVENVIDTAIHYIGHPKASTEELLEILQGPDFPTGGIISNKSDLLSIYEAGTGNIKVRGSYEIEKGKRGKNNIIITEIPYTIIGDGIGKFLQSIADLVEKKVLSDIVDITNQTSKDGVKIVLELKPDADIEYIMNTLYKKTKFEDTFGVNMLVIDKGVPKIYGLKGILNAFTEFQYEIYTRKYTNLLEKAEHKKEVDEGLIKAIDVIDTIIEVLRGSKNIKQASDCLVNGNIEGINFKTKVAEKEAKKFNFTQVQADAILAMRLSRLIGLELNILQTEYNNLIKKIEKYKKILSNEKELRKEIKNTLIELKSKYSSERKTKIIDASPIVFVEKEVEECPIVVLIDKFNYMHCIDLNVYEKNKEQIEDEYEYIIHTTNKSKLLVFTDIGKMHSIKLIDIPISKLKDKGQPIDNISNYDSKIENSIYICSMDNNKTYQDAEAKKLIFLSTDGGLKIVDFNEFNASKKSIDATKLNDGEMVLYIAEYNPNGQIVIGTENGYYIRFKQELIPEKKKTAVGVTSIALEKGKNYKVSYAIAIDKPRDDININGTIVSADRVKLTGRAVKGTKINLKN